MSILFFVIFLNHHVHDDQDQIMVIAISKHTSEN